jgi:hypothetical protein
MFSLPLSDFQRLMFRWSRTQAFHILDAMEVRAPVAPAALKRAAEAELDTAGVAYPVVSESERVEYLDGPARIDVHEYDPSPGESTVAAVQRIATRELNLPLRPNVDPLLRMWLLRSVPHPFVGMTFQHFASDGFAAGDLFRRILARLLRVPIDPNTTLTDTTPLHSGRAFAPWRTVPRLLTYLPDIVREAKKSTVIFTPHRVNPSRTTLVPRVVELPSDCLKSMSRVAKSRDATINDVLATAVAWSIGKAIPERYRRTRNAISVTNMVDLRASLGNGAMRKWGAFLGFALQHLPEPVPEDWREAIPHLREKSNRVKRQKLFFASLAGLWFVRRVWHGLPGHDRWAASAKLMRSSVCLSNSRLPTEWYAGDWDGRLGDYWRFGPLGSLVPLIAVGTTKNDSFRLTLTCENVGQIAERIEEIQRLIVKCLTSG